jgi:hypothetical protein
MKRKENELSKKQSELSNELEIAKHQFQQSEESEKRGQKARMQLLKELRMTVKVDTSKAIPIVEAHRGVCELLETNSEQL